MSTEKIFYPFECRSEKSKRQKRKLVREREDKMKTLRCLVIVVLGICFAAMVYPAWAINPQPEPPAKSIILPLGTKVEKVSAGYFKLKVPEGQTVEIKGFSRSGGNAMIKECRIYNRTGKLIASGKQGVLKSGQKPVEGKIDLSKIDSKGYMKIDDDVTWLPATITFESMKIIDKAGLKGLSP